MKENKGFTKFPNLLLEKLMTTDLTARELKVLLSVIRYTFGYHVEGGDRFSVTRLSELTGINRSNVSRALKSLIERRMVLECIEPDFINCRVISVNLVLDEWETTVAKKQTQTVAKRQTQTVAESTTHTSYIKENNKEIYKYKKNELKKEKKPSYDLELFEQMLNSKD